MRDARPGTLPEKQPKKRAQQPVPELVSEHGAGQAPNIKPRFHGHDAPPDQTLRRVGFHGSIPDFNDHVQAIADAHHHALGYLPSAALTLDLAKSSLGVQDYKNLFPAQNERGLTALRSVNGYTDPADTFLKEYEQAKSEGITAKLKFLHDNDEQLHEYLQDPEFKRKFAGAFLRGEQGYVRSQAAMFHPSFFSNALDIGAKATKQIATGLTIGPAVAAWEEGKASYHDLGSVIRGELPTHLAKTNARLAKGIVVGVKEDVTHPGDNAGNLFLDALGLVSLGAGAAARVGAAGRAAAAGTGVRGVARAAVRRPNAGTYELHYGDATANPLLSENAAFRQVQRLFYSRVQKAADLRHEGVLPAGATGAVSKSAALRGLSRLLHPIESLTEPMVRAEWRAEDRVRAAAREAVVQPIVNAGHWSARTSFVEDLLGASKRKLTNGEQKAIQVLLTDVEGPFANQLDVHRSFHEAMIEGGVGDPAAHRAQLEALTLAEKVLTGKPRAQFVRALREVSRTVDVMESIKRNEMGLLPETARGRVAKAGQAFRGEELTGGEPVNLYARYLPFVSATRKIGKPTDAGAFWSPTVGPFGLPIPGTDPSLTHEFTAHYIKTGDFRIDASNLAAEAYGKTVRGATRLNAWKRLHNASVESYREGYKPIRSERHVPEGLRRIMAKSENEPLLAEDVGVLHDGDLGDFLFPDPLKVMEDDPTVRWVDARLLDSRRVPQSPNPVKRVFTGVNEILRDTILFAKPSYILNALGNAAMAGIHQGPALLPNLIRAATAHARYGLEETRILDGLGGESRSLSYAPDLRTTARLSNKLAQGWNKITDRLWRRAAVIHELKRAGIEDIPSALRAFAEGGADEGLSAKVTEASRRAKKAMVELDNLTWFERESVRHYIFIYPWVSRSLVWSLRTIMEHPIKADLLAHVTADSEGEKALQHAPFWLKDLGYIPTGFDADGNPKVVGFGSVNTFVTLSEAMGLMGGKESIEELLGPGAELSLRLVTNRDRFGNKYETPVIGPLTDSLLGLPQYAALSRSQRSGEPNAKALDITNVQSLVEREHAAVKGETKRTIFVPEGWAALWSLGIGGLHERVVDRAAIDARFWKDQPADERHKHETELVNQMLKVQAGFLKRPLPAEVRSAVDFSFDREFAYKQFATKHGRGATAKEKALITIDMLDVSNAEQAKLLRKLEHTKTPDIQDFTTGLLQNYAGGKALAAWRDDLETVASFERRQLDYFIGNAVDAGVIDRSYRDAANAPTETLGALGRKFLEYEKHIQGLSDAMDGKRRGEKSVLMAQLRDWVDGQDVPVTINGHTFPSLPRLAVSRMNTDQLKAHLVDVYLSSWDGLSVIDKEIASGRKVSPKVTTAWAAFKTGIAEALKKLPANANLSAYQKRKVAQQIDRAYNLSGAFVRDYNFAQLPRARQLRELRFYTAAPAPVRDSLTQILDTARKLELAVATPERDGITNAAAKAAWRGWVQGLVGDDQQPGWIQENDPALWRYLRPYVTRNPDFLFDLMN